MTSFGYQASTSYESASMVGKDQPTGLESGFRQESGERTDTGMNIFLSTGTHCMYWPTGVP